MIITNLTNNFTLSLIGSSPAGNAQQLTGDLQCVANVLYRAGDSVWDALCSMFRTHMSLAAPFAKFLLPLPVICNGTVVNALIHGTPQLLSDRSSYPWESCHSAGLQERTEVIPNALTYVPTFYPFWLLRTLQKLLPSSNFIKRTCHVI